MNTIIHEYSSLLAHLQEMQSQMNILPQGYISKKTIQGKQYFYLQNRVNSKVLSKYIKEDTVEKIAWELAVSKKYKAEIPQIETRLLELEQAARLIDKKLSRELMLLKLSSNMDRLTAEQKSKSVSFANAMNAIEGVSVSHTTETKITNWRNGHQPFLTLFTETLTMYGFPTDVNVLQNLANIKDKELLAKAEADITNLAMLAIYNHQYNKFDTRTLLDINFTIFGQIYDWAGEFRTIQMVKYEDVLGGDTVRYAFPKEIKKQLTEAMGEIAKLKKNGQNDKDIVFRLVRIIASIWQVHPFREGNTRCVIVFAVLLANALGFDVKLELFQENCAYVRNALVWASQGIYSKCEYLERIFFDAMLDDTTDANAQSTSGGAYEMIGDYKVKDYIERPHAYVEGN